MLCFAIINSVLVSLLYAGFVSGQSIVCFCQAGSTTTEHLLHVYSLHATTAEHLLQHTHHTRQQQNICCSIPKNDTRQRNICCSILTTRDNSRTAAAYILTTSDNNGTSAACIPTTSDNNGTSATCIPTTCDNKYSSGYSSNRDEATFGVRKASQSIFWDHSPSSPSSTNLVSDCLRAESSPVDEEKIKIKMDDGVARYFTRLEGNLFIC